MYIPAVRLPRQIVDAVVAHARFCLPHEACGLLAADAAGRWRMAYACTNAAASATRFTIDPVEHFRALQHAERQGWHLAGAFHSHPTSPAYPSPLDVRLAAEPDWLHVIVGRAAVEPELRAFRIRDGRVVEEALDRPA